MAVLEAKVTGVIAASKAFITKFQRDERWLQDSDAGLIVHDGDRTLFDQGVKAAFSGTPWSHQSVLPLPDGGSLLDRVHIIRPNLPTAQPPGSVVQFAHLRWRNQRPERDARSRDNST